MLGDCEVAELSAGQWHTCVRLVGSEVLCWGHGQYGKRGSGDEEDFGDDETLAGLMPVVLQ